MKGLSVVIPSKTLSNFLPCAEAVRRHEPEADIVLVDDGLENMDWLPRPDLMPLFAIPGEKPFIFARNVNGGIGFAGDDDVIVLNDDAILETPGGFSLLQQSAQEHPEFGIISATTNVAGNPEQYRRFTGLREASRSVAFVCVLIPRRTIATVGLMDERFGGTMPDGRRIYGFCDNDMCRRVRNAGLKVGIHDGCYVDHGSLRSTFRGDPHASGDISAAQELYLAKWGDLL